MTIHSDIKRDFSILSLYSSVSCAGKCLLFIGVCFLVLFSCNTPTGQNDNKSLHVSLVFSGPVYKGNYYPSDYVPKTDWSVWIADAANNYVKTLNINIGVVKIIPDSASRANHLPAWLNCTGDSINDPPDLGPVPQRFDGITSASFLFDQFLPDTTITVEWDFTDTSGTTVPEGTYHYWAEVANMEKDSASDTVGYIVNLFSETATGSVQYPSGAAINGAPTASIISFSGVVE